MRVKVFLVLMAFVLFVVGCSEQGNPIETQVNEAPGVIDRGLILVATAEAESEVFYESLTTRGQAVVGTVNVQLQTLDNRGLTWIKNLRSGADDVLDQALDVGRNAVGNVWQTGGQLRGWALTEAQKVQIKAQLVAQGIWTSVDGYSILWVNGDDCYGWAVYHLDQYQKCIGATEQALDSFLE